MEARSVNNVKTQDTDTHCSKMTKIKRLDEETTECRDLILRTLGNDLIGAIVID